MHVQQIASQIKFVSHPPFQRRPSVLLLLFFFYTTFQVDQKQQDPANGFSAHYGKKPNCN